MSAKLDSLAARKAVLLAQVRLQRMELALDASDTLDALRPASLIGGAIAKPAAAVAVVQLVASAFGWRRLTRWVRVASVAFAVYRIVRMRRTGEL